MDSIIDKIRDVEEQRKYSAFSWFLQMKARKNRIPLTVYCELTPECNLSCKMCYSRLNHAEVESAGGLCSIEEWKRWIKESLDLGSMYIAFTGGECLTYPGFDQLYRYAYELGAKIVVMTNAALITRERIEMFTEMPPENISLTMYGFSEETYARTCNNAQAFNQVMAAVKMIHEEKLPFMIKCTVTRDMLHDLESIYRFSKELGARFLSSNVLMTNREACHRDCDKLSVTDNEYERYQRAMYDMAEDANLLAPLIEVSNQVEVIEKGMTCGAGRSTFAINWKGEMLLCNTSDVFKVDLKECEIKTAWQKVVEFADQIPQLTECQTCRFQNRCRKCLFLHYGDTGEFGKVSPRLCWKQKHPEEAIREETEFEANPDKYKNAVGTAEITDCPDDI